MIETGKQQKNLYEQLITDCIIPELIFGINKWKEDKHNSRKNCMVYYFQEDENIAPEVLELVVIIMTPYPYFMGHGEL